MNEILTILAVSLKFILVAFFAVITRIIHEQEPIKINRIFARFIMSLFVVSVSFYVLSEILEYSEILSISVAAALAFASDEVLSLVLKILRNPFELLRFKSIFKDEKNNNNK